MRFLCFMFLKNKRSEGGAVGVVLIQFSKRFRPVAENGNKERHLRSPLEASSQLQKNVIVVVGCKMSVFYFPPHIMWCGTSLRYVEYGSSCCTTFQHALAE
jgi:hypothetical protein